MSPSEGNLRRKANERSRRRKLLAKYPRCIWCGKPWTEKRVPTVEHIVPRALGGSNLFSNLALACAHCNRERGNWYCKHAGHLIEELKRRATAARDAVIERALRPFTTTTKENDYGS